MRQIRQVTAFASLCLLSASIIWPLPAAAQSPQPAAGITGGELVQALRKGGYVIYVRHGATNPDQADTDILNLSKCETQRNLSAEGRSMAQEIGKAFKVLRVPVGSVVSSPYCRAVDTADLAFGRHEKNSSLAFAVSMDKKEKERASTDLRRMLETAPAAGTNTVLVSHTANLKDAAGVWPKREGEAHVFRPRSGGGFDHIGQVSPDDWAQWSRGIVSTR